MAQLDLHMHSYFSDDGEYSPTQLVEMCAQAGVKVMAIADHNSVKAIDEAKREALKHGLIYISAAEFDCTYKGLNLHVLGYGIDYVQAIFEELEENIIHQELKNSELKIQLTNSLGFEVSKEQLDEHSKNGVYTGEMFAEVLLNDPQYNEHELLKPYRLGGSRDANPYVNFYWDYYAQGKVCYTEIKFPTLEEMIKIIHENKGFAVLAHPGNNLKGNFNLIDEMFELGLDGVEAFSSYHTDEINQFFYQKAIDFNKFVTCGSDFHGKTKPSIKIGQTGCTVDENTLISELEKKHLI